MSMELHSAGPISKTELRELCCIEVTLKLVLAQLPGFWKLEIEVIIYT